MSAGDPKIRGTVATSPNLYSEAPTSPRVGYELHETWKYGVTYVKKTLTRTFRCLKKDVQTILASLPVVDAAISAASGVDSSGALQTVDYGTGWKLVTIETPPSNSTTCEINLKYEKNAPTVFEFGLPTNVSVIYSGGKVSFKYGTTVLETWDSKKTAQTTGLTTNVYRYGTLSVRRQQASPVTSYGLITTVGGYVQQKVVDLGLGGGWNTQAGTPLSSHLRPTYQMVWEPDAQTKTYAPYTDYITTVITNDIPLYRLEILLNGVLMETVDQTESDIPLSAVRMTQRYPTSGFLDTALTVAQMEELRLTYGISATIEAKIVKTTENNEWVEKTIYIIGWDAMVPTFDPNSAKIKIDMDMTFDVSVSGHLRLMWFGLVVRDWRI